MFKRIILVAIPILVVAALLVAAIPAKEDVKPMVSYTAKEQMCKVVTEGTVKEVEDYTKIYGEVKVCQDTSDDPLVAGKITIKTVVGWNSKTKNGAGIVLYETKLVTAEGTWKGYRVASTDTDGVTYIGGKAWGVGALSKRPHNNGWQMWYKMTDASPAIILGKYTEEIEEED